MPKQDARVPGSCTNIFFDFRIADQEDQNTIQEDQDTSRWGPGHLRKTGTGGQGHDLEDQNTNSESRRIPGTEQHSKFWITSGEPGIYLENQGAILEHQFWMTGKPSLGEQNTIGGPGHHPLSWRTRFRTSGGPNNNFGIILIRICYDHLSFSL